MKILLSSFLLFSLLFASSCKDENSYKIPYVMVNFAVYPNGIDSDLGVSRYKYFQRYGYRGIIIYRFTSNEFFAYDRACTYDTEIPTAIVAVDATFTYAVCPVCGSKFLLHDGYPFEGRANLPLLQYHTTYNGNDVHVSNN